MRALGDKLAAERKERNAFRQSGGGGAGPRRAEPTARPEGDPETQAVTESVSASSGKPSQDLPEPVAKELAEINAKLDQLLAKCRKPRAYSEGGGKELSGRDAELSGASNGGSTTPQGG